MFLSYGTKIVAVEEVGDEIYVNYELLFKKKNEQTNKKKTVQIIKEKTKSSKLPVSCFNFKFDYQLSKGSITRSADKD